MQDSLALLKNNIDGDLYFDDVMRTLYATDASVYQEMPKAVARPKNIEDIKKLMEFALIEKTSLIPRAAGTSLAGQCVGDGIVVDISKYLTEILEVNQEEKWVRVQPGVIRDELNIYLKQFGLFFGPETSTSNRCMMGGMVGNNACGAHSLIYGSTRDHTLEIKGLLCDGSEVNFKRLTSKEFKEKCVGDSLENEIYKKVLELLNDDNLLEDIKKEYPDKNIERRNTGYALDLLSEMQPFDENGIDFNFVKLLAGSEGTLVFTTEIKLNLVELPPPVVGVVAIHFNTLDDSLRANQVALKYNPGAIELMDDIILECTKKNIAQRKNRFFLEGDPKALLVVEFARNSKEEIEQIIEEMKNEMLAAGYGYAFPVIFGKEVNKVWDLRKAGLGLLSNVPGDAKPVAFIEDTAVLTNQLPEYIEEFNSILKKYDLSCVYYAHAATGELHLRPILNLKDKVDVQKFHDVGKDVALLVKKYKGSLSGEHGDGRLRGQFIQYMYSDIINEAFLNIKSIFDVNNIFNPGKITKTPKMNEVLRYKPGQVDKEISTIFNFDGDKSILAAAEKCNGSADCRKTELVGGTMCPSYMATKDEYSTTRARANILREFLTNSTNDNPFSHQEIYDVMDLCLSCKGCKSECPSNVDIAKLKAEFLYQYYKTHPISWRSKSFGNISKINAMNSKIAGLVNFFMSNTISSSIIKKVLGVAPQRSIPLLDRETVIAWAKKYPEKLKNNAPKKKVYFFCDEFTNYNDAGIGKKAIELLVKLGYEVEIPIHFESGRSYISKGMLDEAKDVAIKNVDLFSDLISDDTPLVGIEPSAILTFRDEYIDLVEKRNINKAKDLSKNVFLVDEFISNEIEKGHIVESQFTQDKKELLVHGHCHQKSLSSVQFTDNILSLPKNFSVKVIPSGCCGMAGSFGYEKEHYDVSMQVGELVLFPEVRKTDDSVVIVAPGTSCRHQIFDGTSRKAYHPVEILYSALA
ncbi:MAG: FAD-binding oxidoreductase [Planctomycetota bacterium]|nr:MAG: FAD-binding oxidoreductase [Planctomycetota bacterium]